MTPPITTGSHLDTGDRRLPQATATAVLAAVEEAVRSALPGTRAVLLSAELEVHAPEALSASAPASAPEHRLRAIVTALAPSPAGARAEIAAAVLPGTGSDPADSDPIAHVRLAFATDLPAPDGLLCPGSKAWTTELGERLRADEEFARLIETYDGTIGLAIGGREVHLRCYRGSVIEASSRSVLGADFVLSIPGDEFIALVQADHNTFMEAAMLRRVSSTGSGYEYLRMTNALVRIIDICRDIAVDAGYADACADRVARTTVLEEA